MDQLLRQLLIELRGAWRFRWLAMAISWVVGIVGIAFVLTLPDIYQARAQVFVDTKDPLLNVQSGRGGAAGIEDAQIKLDYVRRQILSTPNLQQVARDTDLDLRADTPREFDALVAGLQQQITVRPGGRTGFEANLYTILYQDPDRRVAERVVQVLLNSFQERTVEGDLRDDVQALAFLDTQVAEYRRRLEQADDRVADFRRRNAGQAPGDDGGFFARLATLEEQLRQVRTDLRIARDKRNSLAAQARASGEAGSDAGASSLAELENQVLQAERRLDELRLIYTDAHPSVMSAEETVQALKARLDRRREELGPLLGGGTGGAVIENVRIALTQAEIEVAELQAREQDLVQRVGELQQRRDTAPQIEAEYASLVRDHSVLRSQFEGLLQRREQLSFDIDRKRQGRQLDFRIIEPPLAPPAPVAPNRVLYMLMALAAALGAGLGVAFLLHQLRPVYVSGDSVYQDLQIPVLGTVSMAWTHKARVRRRGAEAAFAVGLFLLVAVFGGVFAFMPTALNFAQGLLG